MINPGRTNYGLGGWVANQSHGARNKGAFKVKAFEACTVAIATNGSDKENSEQFLTSYEFEVAAFQFQVPPTSTKKVHKHKHQQNRKQRQQRQRQNIRTTRIKKEEEGGGRAGSSQEEDEEHHKQ